MNAEQNDNITDAEISDTIDTIRAANQVQKMREYAFDRNLQIRLSERGFGLVWEGDGETWAIVPDPFYTKDFLFRGRGWFGSVAPAGRDTR